jgi:hypothetical protein
MQLEDGLLRVRSLRITALLTTENLQLRAQVGPKVSYIAIGKITDCSSFRNRALDQLESEL